MAKSVRHKKSSTSKSVRRKKIILLLKGYQLLHGTNKDVGDFQITGKIKRIGDKCFEGNITYQWNDIIHNRYTMKKDIKISLITAVISICLCMISLIFEVDFFGYFESLFPKKIIPHDSSMNPVLVLILFLLLAFLYYEINILAIVCFILICYRLREYFRKRYSNKYSKSN